MFTKLEVMEHEKEAQLITFNIDDSFLLAQRVIELAGEDASKICISIYKGKRELFFLAGKNTSYENECWIRRKRNVVYHHEKSSMLIRLEYNENEEEYYQTNGLNREEYALAGGGFPVRVMGNGYEGCLTVSGLTMEEDHMLCVNAIKMLRQEQEELEFDLYSSEK
ncbi:hypothetical protein A499_00675 [Niallia nealsonii AAU1]|nr:hypothetical protein A499_00675 [Niallia nealsonii AAU1]